MKMSIATISLSGDLVEKLEAAASAGFAGVEVFDNDLLSFSGTAADARRIAADLGLEIVSFQPFRDFEGMPPAKRERVFARAERKFDIMQELGCDLLVVCSNTAPDSVDDVVRAASDLRELGERASARGVRVGFKALAWARHIKTYQDAWEAVRGADHKAIGLILDSFHTFAGASRFDRPARNPWLLHLPRAPCRRHGDPSGPSRPEPALHELPWSGRAAPAGVHGGAAGHRVRRAAVAGNLQ